MKNDDADYEVIKYNDNQESRGENEVSVCIDRTSQVNVGLPDYDYEMSIYISTHISDFDEDASLFEKTVEEVREVLDVYVMKDRPLSELFEEIPVVGFFFNNISFMVVDDTYGKCNLAHLTYRIVTSF